MNNIDKKIKKVIAEFFKCDISNLTNSTGPGDIPHWDSLGHLTLIEKVREEFGKSIPMAEALEVKSIADLVALIKRFSNETSN